MWYLLPVSKDGLTRIKIVRDGINVVDRYVTAGTKLSIAIGDTVMVKSPERWFKMYKVINVDGKDTVEFGPGVDIKDYEYYACGLPILEKHHRRFKQTGRTRKSTRERVRRFRVRKRYEHIFEPPPNTSI